MNAVMALLALSVLGSPGDEAPTPRAREAVPYTAAVRDYLPNAVLVYDHFHVIKLFNEKLTDLRRDLYRQAVEGLHKDVLKGIRWLLLTSSGARSR